MKTLSVALTLALLFGVTNTGNAQNSPKTPAADKPQSSSEISFGGLEPTEEMWFYLQERERHDDPKAAVRRAAEIRAAQRRHRLAMAKAAGVSLSRPNVRHTVFGGFWTDPQQYRRVHPQQVYVVPRSYRR